MYQEFTVPHNSSGNKIRILIADDHPLLRRALRSILQTQADFEVIGEAANGEELIKFADKLNPEVIFVDISMPKVNGIEATRYIKKKHRDIAVIVLTVHDDSEHVYRLLEVGADAYLTKSIFDNEVITAVRSVVAGETVLGSPVSKQLIREVFGSMARSVSLSSGANITRRELEILKLLANGKSNKDISDTLDLSLRTVKGYLTELFSKLGVSSRTEAVITAIKGGIISFD